MKWIGQHIYDVISRFRNDVYLESISSGTIASGGNLGLDSNNKIVKQADTGITDLHGAGVDGSANQLLTDDGDGTVTSEGALTFASEILTIGNDDNGSASIKRLAHSDGDGGDLSILGGSGTAGQSDKAGGDLNLKGGANTGDGAGGAITFNVTTASGSTGTSIAAYTEKLKISSAGIYALGGFEIGHTSDTTLTRASSGDLNIEGNIIYRAGGTDVPVTDGGTGASTLTDNAVLTGTGTSAITAESTLSYSSEILDIGADDDGAATIRRLRHTDETGGDLYLRGGDATGTNKAGGDLQIFGGRATGNAAGGAVVIQAGETNASSGTSLRGVNVVASFRSDGDTLLQGNLIFEGESPDAHETTFSITDPTGDRTVTVPDADVDLTKVRAASATLDGVVELATTAEADTGTDTTRAITAAGLKSHVDARFSYQYIALSLNATTPADGDWMYASGNGIANHLYNQDAGAGGTTPHNTDGSASQVTLSKNHISGGIIVPYDCTLVGFYAHSRASSNDQKALGIFTGTAVWNDYADITAHLRAYSEQDISAGPDTSYSIRPVQHSVLNINKALSAGDQMWPVARSVGGGGGGVISSMTIVLKTLIPS